MAKLALFTCGDGKVKSSIETGLIVQFLVFLNTILPILRKFMTERQVEIVATKLWQNFVEHYEVKSSAGNLMTGNRMSDDDRSFFFCEKTFGKPEERIKEWGDRLLKFTFECADTDFGETFTHALLAQIRVHRCSVCDANKNEVEWFKMDGLTWADVEQIVTEVCKFTSAIKATKEIVKIDVNTASKEKLMQIPHVGPKLAAKIISIRSLRLFSGLEDLKNRVRRIGERTINAFKEFVSFSQDGANAENTLVNINQASLKELQSLPGIGDSLAQYIVNYRAKNRFTKIEDLKKVPKIGKETFKKVANRIAC